MPRAGEKVEAEVEAKRQGSRELSKKIVLQPHLHFATMSKSDVLAKRLADHGRHIFAYNHVWTNQVVYSFDRSLNVRLPFLIDKKTRLTPC